MQHNLILCPVLFLSEQSSTKPNKEESEDEFVVFVGPDGQEFEIEAGPNASAPSVSEIDKENPEDPDSTTTEPPIGLPLGGIAALAGGGIG